MTTATQSKMDDPYEVTVEAEPQSNRDRIYAAVDALEAVRAKWQNSPHPEPPDTLRERFDDLILLLGDGQIVEEVSDLYRAAIGLLTALQENDTWRQVAWRYFDELIDARRGITRQRQDLEPKRPEPVKLLRDQKVSDHQICKIWASGKEGGWYHGPLFRPNGSPDTDAINREAEKPGSVIPEGFIPFSEEQEKLKREQSRSQFVDLRPLIAEAMNIEHRRDEEADDGSPVAPFAVQF